MYQTPELRLVGAAQSLVLGPSVGPSTALAVCDDKNPLDLHEGFDRYQDIDSW